MLINQCETESRTVTGHVSWGPGKVIENSRNWNIPESKIYDKLSVINAIYYF